jgi:hypothetical protein
MRSIEISEINSVFFMKVPVKVAIPSKGPVATIEPEELIMISLFPPEMHRSPIVYVRPDFPSLPHVTRVKGSPPQLCLTREPMQDWWVGKTLVDLVLRVHEWLCDAAAGKLVKSDDPYEPLVITSENPPVELNSTRARSECAKHDGLWETSSCEISPDGRTEKRFRVGIGDVPTIVVHQGEPQPVAWLNSPNKLEDVLGLISEIGVDTKRLKYWLDKKSASGGRVLVVVGVRRPKNVLGRPDAEEWAAFDIHTNPQLNRRNTRKLTNSDGPTVTSHVVLESFTPSLGTRVSGWKDGLSEKRVVIIGAGAFGSIVAELLARSGLPRLTILDNDSTL